MTCGEVFPAVVVKTVGMVFIDDSLRRLMWLNIDFGMSRGTCIIVYKIPAALVNTFMVFHVGV
jgi:hypothetical protein